MMYLTIELTRDDKQNFVALCPELNVTGVSADAETAVIRLKTIIKFCFDSAAEHKVSLEDMGLNPDPRLYQQIELAEEIESLTPPFIQ